MYDAKNQLLVKNPINRYLINSPMMSDMKKNKDGSLTLYIQKDSPGKDKESQCAAGAGRRYLPGDAPRPAQRRRHRRPGGEGTWQPPGIVQAK